MLGKVEVRRPYREVRSLMVLLLELDLGYFIWINCGLLISLVD